MRYPKNVASAAAWSRLESFLVLGSETGTYCVAESPWTLENAESVRECLKADGLRVVDLLVEISKSGHAAKYDAALFALALATSPKYADSKTNAAALEVLPQVARTGAHLLNFAGFVENVRGWGRGLRTAVARWYLDKPVEELALHMIQSSHRDLLRLAHPKAKTPAQNALFQWAVDGQIGHLATPQLLNGELRQVYAFENAKRAQSEYEVVRLIEACRMTHEMIPSQWKNSAQVWEALLDTMSYEDLVRNLGSLTDAGVLKPQSASAALVVARLIDRKRVANSGIHPLTLLTASGSSVTNVAKALEDAFYLSFDNVQPTGQRVYLALGATDKTSAVMAMSFVRTSARCTVAVFKERLCTVNLKAADRLETVLTRIACEPKNPNLSQPIEDALNRRIEVDAFVLMIGDISEHPAESLDRYRKATGIATKLVVIAMNGGVSESADPHCLHVAGFDASVPDVVAKFICGRRSSA